MFVLKLSGIQKTLIVLACIILTICLHNSGIILSEVLLINFPFLNLSLICTPNGFTKFNTSFLLLNNICEYMFNTKVILRFGMVNLRLKFTPTTNTNFYPEVSVIDFTNPNLSLKYIFIFRWIRILKIQICRVKCDGSETLLDLSGEGATTTNK